MINWIIDHLFGWLKDATGRRIGDLLAEIARLTAALSQCAKEKEALQLQLRQHDEEQQKKRNAIILPVLRAFFDSREPIDEETLYQRFEWSWNAGRYHLELLLEEGLIRLATAAGPGNSRGLHSTGSWRAPRPATYGITQKGRAWIMGV